MRRGRLLLVLVLLGAFGLLSACVPPPPDPPPPDPSPPPSPVAVETWVGGLSIPWDIAFAGTTMLFTERGVGIRVVKSDRSVATLTNSPADLVAANEGGMLGLAVDPAFGTNRRIYACFVSNLPGSGTYDVRVARFTVDTGFTTLSDRADIVTGMPVNTTGSAGRHSGCRLRFGPDGMLWIGTGDAAMGTKPQDLTSLGGKVLRVATDGTAPSPANPNLGAGTDARIYTYGHRNVQGLAFRGSGTPYSVEHGTACDDELNRLVAGANYGWDPVPGYDEGRPMTDLGKFPTARSAVWSSGCPTIAPSGATFLSGAQWGDWNGRLAIAVLKNQQLRIVQLDGGGDAVLSTIETLTGYGRLRTPVQGPDGALYVTTANGSNDQILRVTRA